MNATSSDIPAPTCAEHVVAALQAHGIDTLYCLPGVQNDHFFDALYDARDRIRIVHTRHEQGAAYMALGAAMATGMPAAYCVVPGPGVLNTTAALSTAWACNAPVLAITGQIPQRHIGRGYGILHELPDQLGVLRSLTKWAGRITGPQDARSKVDEAFRQLASGRPRPVALECAIDVWGRRGHAVEGEAASYQLPAVDERLLDRAAELLLAAKRPLIVVGGGAQEVPALVQKIAETLQAPVMAARMGRGVLDSRHPLSISPPVGHRLWPEVDLVLGIGSRLQVQYMVWGMDAGIKVVRIEPDAEEMERHAVPDVGICAPAANALPGLLQRLEAAGGRREGAAEALAPHRAAFEADLEAVRPQREFLDAIRSALPEDGIFVEEMTQVGYTSRFALPVYRPRTFLSTGYQGTLGWGYASALGAKVARPDVPVVSINGDGGFMFNVQELATAAQHRIAVVAIVFDDGAFGNVRRLQQMQFPGRNIAETLVNPDFVALAHSFGVWSKRADDAAQLHAAVKEAIALGQPALIHVPVGSLPDPFRFLNMKRLRG
jgi:acetolactate synthase I/II/III large subunit